MMSRIHIMLIRTHFKYSQTCCNNFDSNYAQWFLGLADPWLFMSGTFIIITFKMAKRLQWNLLCGQHGMMMIRENPFKWPGKFCVSKGKITRFSSNISKRWHWNQLRFLSFQLDSLCVELLENHRVSTQITDVCSYMDQLEKKSIYKNMTNSSYHAM